MAAVRVGVGVGAVDGWTARVSPMAWVRVLGMVMVGGRTVAGMEVVGRVEEMAKGEGEVMAEGEGGVMAGGEREVEEMVEEGRVVETAVAKRGVMVVARGEVRGKVGGVMAVVRGEVKAEGWEVGPLCWVVGGAERVASLPAPPAPQGPLRAGRRPSGRRELPGSCCRRGRARRSSCAPST